jgi:hypothetical protein
MAGSTFPDNKKAALRWESRPVGVARAFARWLSHALACRATSPPSTGSWCQQVQVSADEDLIASKVADRGVAKQGAAISAGEALDISA